MAVSAVKTQSEVNRDQIIARLQNALKREMNGKTATENAKNKIEQADNAILRCLDELRVYNAGEVEENQTAARLQNAIKEKLDGEAEIMVAKGIIKSAEEQISRCLGELGGEVE